MTVLFTCGREPSYPRNLMIHSSLNKYFSVTEITESSKSLPIRYVRLGVRLLFSSSKRIDKIFVGFLGQPIVPLVKYRYRHPIYFDAFLSVYDTLCFDRKQFKPDSLVGKLAFWMDSISCKLADQVIIDTQAHADYFHSTFGIPNEKLKVLYVGCDENLFYPRLVERIEPIVLFYGTFLPLHGIDVIVGAANLLKKVPNIRFRIVGQGRESDHIRQLVSRLKVDNIEFSPSVPLSQLPHEIARSTICLGGHFGPGAKARRVIAGKTFQCIAMGKATIVGDNPANRELLTHEHDAWFCPMEDPDALADAILKLMENQDLRNSLGKNARQIYLKRASLEVLGQQVRDIVLAAT